MKENCDETGNSLIWAAPKKLRMRADYEEVVMFENIFQERGETSLRKSDK